MPQFAYTASTDAGAIVNGMIEAASEEEAISNIEGKGLFPIELASGDAARRAAAQQSVAPAISFSFGGRVPKAELLNFTRELANLLNAQLPLDRCLDMVYDMTDHRGMKAILKTIRDDVQGGSAFSDSLEKHRRAFPPIYINMIRAGEASGALESVAQNLLDFLEEENELIASVKASMTYPILLGVLGIGVVVLLLVKIIPSFTEMLSEMGKALPLPTLILINFSDFVTEWWWALLAGAGALGVSVWSYYQTPTGKLAIDGLKLSAPVFGDLARKISTARFCRVLGVLIRNEVPILQAMTIVKDILNNAVMARAIDVARERLKEGDSVAGPLQSSGVLPKLAIRLISIGEETGQLDDMLLKSAAIYDLQTKTRIKQLVALIEPVMMVAMAGVVGFIVMAMLTAILSVSDF